MHSSTDGHLGCFQIWVIVNNAAMNIKIQMTHLTELEQKFQKFIWITKYLNNNDLEKEEQKVGGIMPPNNAIVIKTAWYRHKNRHIDKWNRIESPEINPHIYSQLIFGRGSKHM